jgi:glycosyltransferase involved in cell wall biosynthesis
MNDKFEIPLVSYLIPSYNHSHFVTRTLNSIIEDDYPNKEVVVVYDGSTDDSVETVLAWKSRHPEISCVVLTQSNSGVSATLNRLIRESTGKYLRFCASDDMMVRGGTQKLVHALQKHDEVQAAFGDCIVVDVNDESICESSLKYNGSSSVAYERYLGESLICNWAVAGPSILIEKSFFIEYGFFDERLTIEDWFLYLRLLANRTIAFESQPVAKYRIHSTNTCKVIDPKKRIANLESQLLAARLSYPYFSMSLRILLLSQIYLLRAKKLYLQKKFVAGGFVLIFFLALNLLRYPRRLLLTFRDGIQR